MRLFVLSAPWCSTTLLVLLLCRLMNSVRVGGECVCPISRDVSRVAKQHKKMQE